MARPSPCGRRRPSMLAAAGRRPGHRPAGGVGPMGPSGQTKININEHYSHSDPIQHLVQQKVVMAYSEQHCNCKHHVYTSIFRFFLNQLKRRDCIAPRSIDMTSNTSWNDKHLANQRNLPSKRPKIKRWVTALCCLGGPAQSLSSVHVIDHSMSFNVLCSSFPCC